MRCNTPGELQRSHRLRSTNMTSLPNPISETAHAVAPDAHRNGILVASDGREPSIAALIAARKLAAHVTFGVLSVVPSSVSRERARRSAEETIDRDERAAVIEAQSARDASTHHRHRARARHRALARRRINAVSRALVQDADPRCCAGLRGAPPTRRRRHGLHADERSCGSPRTCPRVATSRGDRGTCVAAGQPGVARRSGAPHGRCVANWILRTRHIARHARRPRGRTVGARELVARGRDRDWTARPCTRGTRGDWNSRDARRALCELLGHRHAARQSELGAIGDTVPSDDSVTSFQNFTGR